MSTSRSPASDKRASGVLKPGTIASSPSGSVTAVTPKKPSGPPPDTRRSVGPKPGKKKVIEMKDNKTVLATDRSETAAFDHDDMQPLEVRRVPDDQVKDLTPAQKTEVFTKVLAAINPKASKNITRFNHKERQFKLESSVDNLVVHFHMNSTLVLADSAEARAQERHAKGASVSTGTGPDEPPRRGLGRRNSLIALAAVAAGTAVSPDDEEFVATAPDEEHKGRALKNQFNFSERASQTFNNPLRDREAQTEPPPTKDFSGNLTQWAIFDAYLEDFLKQLAAKNAKENTKARSDKEEGKAASGSSDPLENPSLCKAVKLMERMVNQNSEDDTFHDFKYFEDASDFSREDGKGQFLPLWKFQSSKAKRKNVTAIVWNPFYNDLFAAGYGSYEFGKQSSGMICCFSLKNTGHPEYTFTTDSGVMCLDFHPKNPALLVAGLYNGSVCVFDVRSKSNKPIYMSSDPKQKHTDPVWQVHWEETEAGQKDLKFHSISSDGRITEWTLTKNELSNEEVIELKLVGRAEAKQDEEQPLLGLAGGSCFDFNKRAPNVFVVGTEEGAIQTYSKEYNAQFLESYDGHNMTVYSVRWNPFHSGVFASCSADWTCKIWKQTSRKPIMTFDLSNSVGDIAWAPYSSTVFATASADGKLRLFDLNVSKHEPIGETKVVKKSRLTHVSFNPKEPIVLVGDDNGTVLSFKLSPNLHKMSAPKLEALDPKTETERLDRLLIVEDMEKDGSGVKPAVLFA